jgi:hypothetical protein
MFTWVMASKGHSRLAAVYLVIAALLFMLALGTWAVGAAHSHAAGQTTLELHITRYGG